MPKTVIDLESLRQSAVRAVTEIFQTMLDVETHALEGTGQNLSEHAVFGSVHLVGAWSGAVLLKCQAEQAYVWTSKMMSIPQPTCLNDDVRDAMGELASMVAGNFKSVLPVGTSLSMPTVVEGQQFTFRLMGAHDRIKMDFECPQGPFSLTVLQLIDD